MTKGRPRENKSLAGSIVSFSNVPEKRKSITADDKDLYDALKKQEEYLKIKRENAAQAGRLVFKDVMINKIIEVLKLYDKGVVKMLDFMPAKLIDCKNKTQMRKLLSEEIERARKQFLSELATMQNELDALKKQGNTDLLDIMGERDE